MGFANTQSLLAFSPRKSITLKAAILGQNKNTSAFQSISRDVYYKVNVSFCLSERIIYAVFKIGAVQTFYAFIDKFIYLQSVHNPPPPIGHYNLNFKSV